MKKEQVKDFTRRITQSNRGAMVVVVYDIFFAYLEDAREAYELGQPEQFKKSLQKAQRCIDELMGVLNFKYAVSRELYPLYVFAKESLAKAVVRNGLEDLDNAKKVMEELKDAFAKVAEQDASAPLMRNTQKVYAGMTYGKHNLTETYQVPDTSRGFFA